MYSFKYKDYKDKEKKLFVFLPAEMKYDFDFIDAIAEFMEKVEESEGSSCLRRKRNELVRQNVCCIFVEYIIFFGETEKYLCEKRYKQNIP